MVRWPKALIALAIAIGCFVLAVVVLTASEAVRNFHRVEAEAIEREARVKLPVGSSRSAVEDFLGKRALEHRFEASSSTDYAVARNVKGSSLSVTKSVGFQFHFDGEMKLKSIDTKVYFTGP